VSRRVDRLFVDANVLFSAAYMPDSRLRRLWSLADTELVTSGFALEEARRNLLAYNPDCLSVLDELSAHMTVAAGVPLDTKLPRAVDLADKDRPVLSAARAASCTHLLTGGKRHFGPLYGRNIQGVLVLTPAQYLQHRKGRR